MGYKLPETVKADHSMIFRGCPVMNYYYRMEIKKGIDEVLNISFEILYLGRIDTDNLKRFDYKLLRIMLLDGAMVFTRGQ